MKNNTYYTCECACFDSGYILCKTCTTWLNVGSKSILFGRRWCRKPNALKKKSKKQVCVTNI